MDSKTKISMKGHQLDKSYKPKPSEDGFITLMHKRETPKPPKIEGNTPWRALRTEFTLQRNACLKSLGISNVRDRYSKYEYILRHKNQLNQEQLIALLADQGVLFQNSFDRIADSTFTADEFFSNYRLIMRDINSLKDIPRFLRRGGYIRRLNSFSNRRINKQIKYILEQILEDKCIDVTDNKLIFDTLSDRIRVPRSLKKEYNEILLDISNDVAEQSKKKAALIQDLKKWNRFNGHHYPYAKDFEARKQKVIDIFNDELESKAISYRLPFNSYGPDNASDFFSINETYITEQENMIIKDLSQIISTYRNSYLIAIRREKLQDESKEIYKFVINYWHSLRKENALSLLPFFLYRSFTQPREKDIISKNIDFKIESIYRMKGNKNFRTRKEDRNIVHLNIGFFERLISCLNVLDLDQDSVWRQFVHTTGYYDQYHSDHAEQIVFLDGESYSIFKDTKNFSAPLYPLINKLHSYTKQCLHWSPAWFPVSLRKYIKPDISTAYKIIFDHDDALHGQKSVRNIVKEFFAEERNAGFIDELRDIMCYPHNILLGGIIMSKKVVRNKKATFSLEPDGFSIHTFELSYKCTAMEWKEMKETLYEKQKTRQDNESVFIYKESDGKFICPKYQKHGIRINLEHYKIKGKDKGEQRHTYYLRIVVNPRILIDSESSYIGILPPTLESVKALKKAFTKLFKDSVFPNDINSYQLRRIDLCTNIRCDNQKIFRETVRVLRKLPTPPKYERVLYRDKNKNKKAVNAYNKHYIRFVCGTHELIIYDKTFQVNNAKLQVAYEKFKDGILRFEVHCNREYIRNIEKAQPTELETDELLWLFIQESQDRILKHFSQCFDDAVFCVMNEIEARIQASTYRAEKKSEMLALAKTLQRVQSTDKALAKLENEGVRIEKLLDRFRRLGISAIPLRENFCSKQIPGPVELLTQISEGKLNVDYIKTKHK